MKLVHISVLTYCIRVNEKSNPIAMLGKMNYRIYIDESGNTGNVEINRNLNWNFGIQTRFVLGAVCVAENNLEVLKEEIERILNKYDPQLGKEK